MTSEENVSEDTFANDEKLADALFMTTSQSSDVEYIIHTPLLSYKGTNENIIMICYSYCLDIAKKFHVHSIAFPIQLCEPGSMEAKDGQKVLGIMLNIATNAWFNDNNNYGMSVLINNVVETKS